jgi:hypothetical protein
MVRAANAREQAGRVADANSMRSAYAQVQHALQRAQKRGLLKGLKLIIGALRELLACMGDEQPPSGSAAGDSAS